MRELMAHAAALGVAVHVAHLPHPYRGYYDNDAGRVYYDFTLAPCERRSVLAHELGHAFYGHDCDSPRNERQADIYAARLLIDPEEYARLERINPDQHDLADELGVTVETIFTFERHCLTRLRGVTYAIPRLGARQAAYSAAPMS